MKRMVLSTDGVPEADFSGQLFGFRSEKPDAFVSILLDGEK
jgi:hypothetical protein